MGTLLPYFEWFPQERPRRMKSQAEVFLLHPSWGGCWEAAAPKRSSPQGSPLTNNPQTNSGTTGKTQVFKQRLSPVHLPVSLRQGKGEHDKKYMSITNSESFKDMPDCISKYSGLQGHQ